MKNCLDRNCRYLLPTEEFYFCNLYKAEIFNPKMAGCKKERASTKEVENGKIINFYPKNTISFGQTVQRKSSPQ